MQMFRPPKQTQLQGAAFPPRPKGQGFHAEYLMNTNTGPSMKPTRAVAAAVALILCLSAAQAENAGTSKHYVLPATSENVQWGWYDINEKPKLTIKSGDTVSIETLSHSLGKIKPGVDMDEIVKLRKGNPGGGPHSITGPIY
ncbi:MAG TPA: hypothetical protein VNH39_12780, partial [Steroidobacteraceae bacterium]|nr:hypothetical protein [Steroidobacteraceae bacterium]